MSVQSFDPHAHLEAATIAFVPAPEVVSELLVSKWPREARACLTALTREIGPVWTRSWSPFLCLYGFVEWTGSLAAFPAWAGGTGPTGDPTSAFGPWQDERGTDKEMSELSGNPSVAPQDQIDKNWLLAIRDYDRHLGGDLLTDLKSGLLKQVQQALVRTWPAGADIGFPTRYTDALRLFPVDQTAPIPAPPPPSTIAVPNIPVGDECRLTIMSASDDNGGAVTAIPADLMVPDDATICSATITGMTLVIGSLPTGKTGKTTLRGADLAISVNVVPRPVAHLKIDFASAVLSPIVAAAKSMVARTPMMVIAAALMLASAAPIIEVDAPATMASLATSNQIEESGPPILTLSAETFCFGPDHGFPITICRR